MSTHSEYEQRQMDIASGYELDRRAGHSKLRYDKATRSIVADDTVEGGENKHVDIVFDGPPSPDGPRFIEVEDATGKSFRLGQWVERPDGKFAIRFTAADLP